MPGQQRVKALAEAREQMQLHHHQPDPAMQLDLFKRLCSRISFLRMTTPKQPGDRSSVGAGHFVLRNGELVEGKGAAAGTR
jgi:hypothetical protein